MLAGCGGSANALTSVSAAVDTSLAHVFSARVTLTGAEALGAKPNQVLHTSGVFDVHRALVYDRVDLPGPLDQNKVPPRDFLVFLPAKIFLAPATQRLLPAGKTVISVPVSAGTAAVAGATRFVTQAMGLNPLLLLDEIAAGATAATRTGSEVVAHVPFVDYRVTVDLRRALAHLSGPFARAERIAITQELAALGPGHSSVEVAVRVDGAGFVRDLHTSVPGSKLGRLAMDLHGYGATFKPSYPTPAQIVTLASLAGAWSWSAHWPWILGG